MNCWIHRLRRALAAPPRGASLPPSIARHLRACPACRAEWEHEQSLAHRLTQGALAARSEPTVFIHGRIMAAVRRESVPFRSAPGCSWLRRGALAVSFAAVILVMGILLRPPPPAPVPSTVAIWETNLPDPAELARWGKLLDQPLREEGMLVLQDARNAVAGLTAHLPDLRR